MGKTTQYEAERVETKVKEKEGGLPKTPKKERGKENDRETN